MKRTLLAVTAAALVLTAGLMLAQLFGETAETIGWGLSFREGIPEGPMSADALAKYGGTYCDTRGEKVLYLTFDAGYENGYTGQILDVLQEKGIKAAFFVTGDYLKRNADLIRRMHAGGHTVGNHTMTHPDLSTLGADAFRQELEGVEQLYRDITGAEPDKFLRPPQGLYSEECLKNARNLGYKTVFWSLAYADWDNDRQPSREEAMAMLQKRTHPGAVILLHATSKTNSEILGQMLGWWQDQGYRFGTLEELYSPDTVSS